MCLFSLVYVSVVGTRNRDENNLEMIIVIMHAFFCCCKNVSDFDSFFKLKLIKLRKDTVKGEKM